MNALVFALTAVAIGYVLLPLALFAVPIGGGFLILAAWAMK
jgi:hypothetical protein